MTTATATLLPIRAIAVTGDNPRRTFDTKALRELTESIRTQGVLQPILVRPLPKPNGQTHELIAGERRLRAANDAGLATIPVFVRDMTDAEAQRARIIENLQRADLAPLEEAEAYGKLRQQGHGVPEIATAIAKSQAYVYLRLELLNLNAAAKKALASNELGLSVALLLARIPDESARNEATDQILKGYMGSPFDYRRAQQYIAANYTLDLSKAPFAPDDETLVPEAGTCTACPHRTGNQRELFGDIKAKDVCTKPSCYSSKRDADWARRAESAKAAGKAVLSDKDARKILPGGHIPAGVNMVDLDSRCYSDDKGRTWRQLLKRTQVPVTLARDPYGNPHELVTCSDAATALKPKHPEIAKQLVPEKTRKAEQGGQGDEANLRERQKVAALARRNAVEQLVQRAEAKAFTLDVWKLVATMLLDEVWSSSLSAVVKRREMASGANDRPVEVLRDHIAALDKEGPIRGLVLELLLARFGSFQPELSDNLKAASKAYGIDLAAILVAAKKEMRDSRNLAKAKGK